MKYAVAMILSLTTYNIATASPPGLEQSKPAYETSNSTVAPQVTTLEQALASAYETNPEIKKARADLQSVAELSSQAFGNFLPNLSANVDYGRQHTKIDGADDNGTLDSRSIQAEQPLYHGGSFARSDSAESSAKSAMANLENTEQDVMLNGIGAYMDLLCDIEIMNLAQAKQNALYKQYDETRRRFDKGELTKTDVSQSISRASGANADAQTAEANFEAARANYERTTGQLPAALSYPSALPQIPQTIDEALSQAQSNNPAVRAAKYSELAASQIVDANEDSLLPSVNLRAKADRETDYSLASGQNYSNDSVLVNFTIPLYQSGTEYSKVRQAKADASSKKYDYINISNRVAEEVKAVWKRIYTNAQSIEADQLGIDAAQMALAGVRKEERLGTRSVLDVLDAEQELFTAKTRLLTAKRDQTIAYYTLLAKIGRLTAKDLNLPVEYYDAEKHYDDVKHKFIGF